MLEEEDEGHHTKCDWFERFGVFASSKCMVEVAALEASRC